MAVFQFDQNESEMNIPKESPASLRVLVADDSPTFQSEIEERLQSYSCTVIKCSSANAALDLLSQPENSFDIVLVDADLPDIGAFRLHSYIADEMDLPIIMMSADDEKDTITTCAINGACDNLIKPISDEALNNIYQYGLRKRREKWDGQLLKSSSDDAEVHSGSSSRKRKDGDKPVVNRDDNKSVVLKKQRMVWSPELRQKFIEAVNQLGVDKAVPKKILELMNVSWITRENVASHLQKYRLQLKRDAELTQSSNMPSSSSDMVMPINDQRSHMVRFDVPRQQQQVQNFKQLNLHQVGSLKEAMKMQYAQKHSNEAYLSGNQFSKLPFEQSMLFGGNGIVPFNPNFELPSNSVPYNYTYSNCAISGQQNPNVAQHVQSQNGVQHVQNQNVARHVQSQNGFQHVQNQNVARHVQNQNVAQHPISIPLDYSVQFKLEISQNPNSETTLLQQPFDRQEFMNSHPMQRRSFCTEFDL